MLKSQLKIFGLSTNHALAEAVAKELHTKLGLIDIQAFADGEIYERVLESVRGTDVFVVSPIAVEANDSFMQIMIVIDALRRASAKTINVVIPYFGYGRSDRKAKAREPITAKLIASLLEMNGADRIISIDFHAPQLQGFFNVPVDHLLGAPLLSEYFKQNQLVEDLVVVSPDHTGAGRARNFADLLDAPWGVVNDLVAKETPASPEAIVGDVTGKNAIIIDDIIDSGQRMEVTARALRANGAKSVRVVATHPVFSELAGARLAADDDINEIIVTDTIPLINANQSDKLTVLSVAPMLAHAIEAIHEERTLNKYQIAQADDYKVVK